MGQGITVPDLKGGMFVKKLNLFKKVPDQRPYDYQIMLLYGLLDAAHNPHISSTSKLRGVSHIA